MNDSKQSYEMDYIVCFLDILGFKDIVKKSSKIQEPLEKLKQLKKLKEWSECPLNTSYSPTLITFSDSLIYSLPIDDNYWPFFTALNDIAFIIANAVGLNLFLRGAISIGSFYYEKSNSILVSKALINAYELETTVSNFPRIILDPYFFKYIVDLNSTDPEKLSEICCNDIENEIEGIFNQLKLDNDGYYYVDYIDYVIKNEERIFKIKDFFKSNKNNILDNLNKYKDNYKILSKYIWLSNYTNGKINDSVNKYENMKYLKDYIINNPTPGYMDF